MSKGSIIVQAEQGRARSATLEILGVASLAEVVALADGLKSYTCGKIISCSYTETQVYDTDAYIAGKKDSPVNDKMIMTFRRTAPATGQSPTVTFKWPAPIDELLVYTKDGIQMNEAQGDAIAAILNARVAALDVEFDGGRMNK